LQRTGGKIKLEEIYRFENGISKIGNEYCWNIDQLFNDIKAGIKCRISYGRCLYSR
jgi:hypothetical protein